MDSIWQRVDQPVIGPRMAYTGGNGTGLRNPLSLHPSQFSCFVIYFFNGCHVLCRADEDREELGEWLNRRLTPGESFVIGNTGLVSYITEANEIDAYCLNSPEMTRSPINRSPKMFVEMIFRLRPEAIVVSYERKDEMKPHTYFGVYPLIVGHPSLELEYRSVRTFGVPGDFFRYIVFMRKDRIPLDEPG